MKFNIKDLKWVREPKSYTINEDKIEIVTKPHTDLWQRTYYKFRNNNAPVLQTTTDNVLRIKEKCKNKNLNLTKLYELIRELAEV